MSALSKRVNLVSQTSGLTVRQHERETVRVAVEFTVGQSIGTQVRFSGSSGAVGSHVIRGEAIDISSGGMGLRTNQFLPRMCEGIVQVFTPSAAPSSASDVDPTENVQPSEVILEQRVKVRRVTMIGREPTYSIGVAFVQPSPALDRQIAELFQRIQDSSANRGHRLSINSRSEAGSHGAADRSNQHTAAGAIHEKS